MDIPLQYKQLWSDWDVRVLILLSLSIQIVLIFLGRMRRTFNSRLTRMMLWASYLLANWVADFVLGKLSSNMDESSASNAIIAFWAPFLILHLGGPDTITAYSMEDNELWARHLLGLIYELFISFYVLFRSLPNTHLLAPTLLMFLVAIIKYVERSSSLYKASIEGFRNSTRSLNVGEQPEDLNTLNKAFWLYSANKPLFIDDIPNINRFYQSNDLMSTMPSGEILRAVLMELSFACDEFYTKTIVSHCKAGYFLRVLCSTCILLVLSLFVKVPKNDFKNVDVAITYVLLVASICLDVMATVMLVFSDWMVVSLHNVKKLSNWSMWFTEHIDRIKRACHKRRYQIRKMPQLNLLVNCLIISTPNKALGKRIMNWILEKLRLVQVMEFPFSIYEENNTLQMMQPVRATQDFMEIIASNMERYGKKMFTEDGGLIEEYHNFVTEEFSKPAGLSALQKVTTIADLDFQTFFRLFKRIPLDQQVLVWHVTTELCFHLNTEPQYNYLHEGEIKVNESKLEGEMKACKILSDYVMHIVLKESDMIPTMEGPRSKKILSSINKMILFARRFDVREVKELCKVIMATPIELDDSLPFGSSLFLMSKVLAHLMVFIEKQDRWHVITTAWINLLMNVAYNSSGSTHLKKLSWGDELLTIIWLFIKQTFEKTYVTGIYLDVDDDDLFMKAKYLYKDIEDHRS